MATVTYPSMTSRQTQQSSANGALSAGSQTTSVMVTRSQAAATGSQLATPQSSNTQLSKTSSPYPINNSPSTPSQSYNKSAPQPATPASSRPIRESPGAWKHPRAEEIAKRQRAGTFGPDNVSVIARSIGILVLVSILRRILPDLVWRLMSPITDLTGTGPLWLVWAFVAYSLCVSIKPLFYGQDQLLDIDLNATQRSLLGLDPNATPPATPATKYITPPKYTRSVNGRDGTPGSRGSSPAGSPSAYRDTPSHQRNGDGYSPHLESSRRASHGSDVRRQSFGLSSSVFGTPSKDGSVFAPQTPSPIGRASGIPFSNKWLYHKGRSGSLSRDSF